MSDVVIKVENLWKEYRLGVVNHGTLKRDLQSWWARVRGHDDPNTRIDLNASTAPEVADRFWALRDVSFDVRQGEVLGIIGRNGAGKSTLLKILSRVTTPSKGEVKIRGRVASLLEVGTGFHPELTGRENIFLNGAILGMSKAEIRAKLDEIVDFSGVEKFIDTPVKRYSSGMYVRLAFAVAAHLDPEILIIDEVLAVGDAEFQKKCLGKMGEVAKGGRTVLFVSHNMAAVSALTNKCVYLKDGKVNFIGGTADAVAEYTISRPVNSQQKYTNKKSIFPYISKAEIHTSVKNNIHQSGEAFSAEFVIEFDRKMPKTCFSFHVYNEFDVSVAHFWQYDSDQKIGCEEGSCLLKFNVPKFRLNVGRYRLTCFLSDPPGGQQYECLNDICEFEVVITNRSTLFGWRPAACTHVEEFSCEARLMD